MSEHVVIEHCENGWIVTSGLCRERRVFRDPLEMLQFVARTARAIEINDKLEHKPWEPKP